MMKKPIIAGIAFLCSLMFIFACNNIKKNQDKNKEDSRKAEKKGNSEISIQDTIEQNETYNSIARILAGKDINDSLNFKEIIKTAEYKNHQKKIKNIWRNFNTQYEVIKAWSDTSIDKCDTVFYPFGGPDFNYLNSFFPDCKFSVLVGLEKTGHLPFLDSLSLSKYDTILNTVVKSIQTNVNLSFFRTYSMQEDLVTYLDGTLPVLLFFLSSHNYEIINIFSANISENGEIDCIDFNNNITDSSKYSNGIEIIYKKAEEKQYRKLLYFSMDLSDDKLKKSSFPKMIEKNFSNKTTFLKAASYLLATDNFLTIKNLILDNSHQIISDPSGIQFKDFDSTWDISLYGKYIGPIKLFSKRLDKELLEAYEKGNATAINFKLGYHSSNPSFIVANKK